MALPLSSPHSHGPARVGRLMSEVAIALIPAIAVHIWLFGPGLLLNIAVGVPLALAAEAAVLAWRGSPVRPFVSDGSAVVTALLLAMALPPLSPWWLTAVGVLFAIVVAKHLYGGLGYNPFNPAMVGYVALLISFPVEMTRWLAPAPLRSGELGIGAATQYVLTGHLPPGLEIDALTAASPLDAMKTALAMKQTVSEVLTGSPIFGAIGGGGWQLVSVAVLLGGVYLIARRVITWHVPVGLLGSLFLIAALFHLASPDQYPSPLFHLFSGAAMLGAFFIATDPVSGATSNRGRLMFGIGAGLFIYVIRTWGGYPDAVAFSILLMNMAAPTIDYYTQPRVYGHGAGE